MVRLIKSWLALVVFFVLVGFGGWSIGELFADYLREIGVSHDIAIVIATISILFGSLWSIGFVIDSLRNSGRHEGLAAAAGICMTDGPDAFMELLVETKHCDQYQSFNTNSQ